MEEQFTEIIERFRVDLVAEIEESRIQLTTTKSKDFFAAFENKTDRIDAVASSNVTNLLAHVTMVLRPEEVERLRNSILQVNIQLRNEFRQSYIELKDIHAALLDTNSAL